MSDHEELAGLLSEGDWPAVIDAITATPELLEARFAWSEQTVLHHAVIAGNVEAVKALLDLGADVMARDGADNATPLHWAADRGDLTIAKLLVAQGADPDSRDDVHGWGPLGWATLGEMREDVGRWLMDVGAAPRIFPLIALDDGPGLRELLASNSAPLNERMSKWEHYECPLHFAIGRGATESFGILLEAGVEVDALNWVGLSPLAVAGFCERPRFAERLEERGVEPDLSAALAWRAYAAAGTALEAEPGALSPKARYGRLLMYAAENDQSDAVAWLLDNGANPNTVHDWWDNRLTALHPAASHGALGAVRALVEAGADTSVRDEEFDGTPLEWARHFECDDVVAYLEPLTPIEDEATETIDLTNLDLTQMDLGGVDLGMLLSSLGVEEDEQEEDEDDGGDTPFDDSEEESE
jgi:ankyrin repeat protein